MAAIHLAEPLGQRVGWFGVASRRPQDLVGQWAHVTGYPGEKKELRDPRASADRPPAQASQLWHHAAPVVRVDNNRIFYKADTTAGQSGSPIYVLRDEGNFASPVVVGVHAYGAQSTPVQSGPPIQAPGSIRRCSRSLPGGVIPDGGTECTGGREDRAGDARDRARLAGRQRAAAGAAWGRAPQWMKDASITSILWRIENPDAPTSAQHDQWAEQKRAEGWKQGKVKSAVKKTHPLLVPYAQLSEVERRKDALVNAVVDSLIRPLR